MLCYNKNMENKINYNNKHNNNQKQNNLIITTFILVVIIMIILILLYKYISNTNKIKELNSSKKYEKLSSNINNNKTDKEKSKELVKINIISEEFIKINTEEYEIDKDFIKTLAILKEYNDKRDFTTQMQTNIKLYTGGRNFETESIDDFYLMNMVCISLGISSMHIKDNNQKQNLSELREYVKELQEIINKSNEDYLYVYIKDNEEDKKKFKSILKEIENIIRTIVNKEILEEIIMKYFNKPLEDNFWEKLIKIDICQQSDKYNYELIGYQDNYKKDCYGKNGILGKCNLINIITLYKYMYGTDLIKK